jgi:hypothetical protein
MIKEHSKTIKARHIDDRSKTKKLIIPKVFIELIIIKGTSKILTISAYLFYSPHSVS